MALVVQEDQLFVLKGTKGRDVKRPVGIHQQDLVTDEGRSGTESGQGIVATRTEGHMRFVMKQHREFFLEFAPFSNTFPFRVMVQPGFGDNQGSGTTQVIVVIVDVDNGMFLAY